MWDRRTEEYRYRLAALPAKIQELADAAFKTFVANPKHPGLNYHQLEDTKKSRQKLNSWVVHISWSYCALHILAPDDATLRLWYWVGTHEEYNNYTGKK